MMGLEPTTFCMATGAPAEKAGQWPRLLALDAGACAGGQCLYLR
jgi:hypothetical protein